MIIPSSSTSQQAPARTFDPAQPPQVETTVALQGCSKRKRSASSINAPYDDTLLDSEPARQRPRPLNALPTPGRREAPSGSPAARPAVPFLPQGNYVARAWAVPKIHEGLRLGRPELVAEAASVCAHTSLGLEDDEQFTMGLLALSWERSAESTEGQGQALVARSSSMAGLSALLSTGLVSVSSPAVRRLMSAAVQIRQVEGLRLLTLAASSREATCRLGPLADDAAAREALKTTAVLITEPTMNEMMTILAEGFELSESHAEAGARGLIE